MRNPHLPEPPVPAPLSKRKVAVIAKNQVRSLESWEAHHVFEMRLSCSRRVGHDSHHVGIQHVGLISRCQNQVVETVQIHIQKAACPCPFTCVHAGQLGDFSEGVVAPI